MDKKIESIFSKMYEDRLFIDKKKGEDTSISESGPGSDYEFMKKHIPAIEKFLKDFSIQSWLDIGCGDWAWTKFVNFSGNYIGIDIADNILQKTKELYEFSDYPCGQTKSFFHLDAITDKLPLVDFIMAKDVMIHLSLEKCMEFIANVKRSGSKYFGTTQYANTTRNRNIPIGSWADRNYFIAPFLFPKSVAAIEMPEIGLDKKLYSKSITIWRISDL